MAVKEESEEYEIREGKRVKGGMQRARVTLVTEGH